MRELTRDNEVRQALSTIQQYLSDSIAPLLAAESVALLLDQPAQLVAAEIANWASAQYQQKSTNANYSDFLFHAARKLADMGGLRLVREARLTGYLEELKPLILEHCPAEDRKVLAEELSHLGHSEPALTQAVAFIHRMRDPSEGPMASRGLKEGTSELDRMRRRLSILWKRLGKESRESPAASQATSAKREGLVSHVVATAARTASSDEDFRVLQANLKAMGIDSGTDQIFRVLSRNLPGWAIPPQPGAAEGGQPPGRANPTLEAMRQIMLLSEDGSEGCKRFHDMVQAAIEQFNTGMLARAATMFDLASSLASEAKLDAAAVASIRRTSHEYLDTNRLRALAKEIQKHHLLKKVLNFFDAFKVECLLNKLQQEQKRDQRRVLLSLLDVHGDAARDAALQRLRMLLAGSDVEKDWFFPRNLVCILHRIPIPDDVQPDDEIQLMGSLLKPTLPAPLVRETITNVGQIKHPGAEKLLIETAQDLEQVLLDPQSAGQDQSQLIGLLDRTIFALAHFGTPRASRTVVEHGLRRNEPLGDTLARLSYLNGQDLSADEASVAKLVKTLKSRTPLKVFGVVIQNNDQILLHLIKALASTPTPAVQQAFESIGDRFPEKEFGKAAAKALEEFTASGKRTEVQTERLMGDLELFSLPDLLQQLALLQLTGTLSIKDVSGTPVGAMSMIGGRMQDCSAGRLQGEEAAYQILERPVAGSFVFQGRRDPASQEQVGASQLRDMRSILFEGVRRYDELERARAVVPDSSLLKPLGVEPVPRTGEDDTDLFTQVWKSIGSGATPEKCEAECVADSFRIRSLLARWVEEDLLSVH